MTKLTKQEAYKEALSDNLLASMDAMQESIEDFRLGRINIYEFKRMVDWLQDDTTKVANLTDYVKSTEV